MHNHGMQFAYNYEVKPVTPILVLVIVSGLHGNTNKVNLIVYVPVV